MPAGSCARLAAVGAASVLDHMAVRPNHRGMTTDPQAATAAYIDGLGADTLAKAAAYTTGNHWLLLWTLVKTAEYRNPRPSRLEEWLFYDHPSVERRVLRAMEWQASREAG